MASTSRASRRCRVCDGLRDVLPKTWEDPPVNKEISYWACFANAGKGRCVLCRLLIDAVTSPLASRLLENFDGTVQEYLEKEHRNTDVKIHLRASADHWISGDPALRIRLCAYVEDKDDLEYNYTTHSIHSREDNLFPELELFSLDKETPSPSIVSGKIIRPDGFSPEVMGLALSWLIDCCNNHEYCHRLQPNSLPDRYLYVGRDRDPELRINTGSDTGYYATLSHCWGGNINLRLTTENLEALSRGIPLSSLPKNFQEAVHVCRALKIEYLWIDSLCIIQNSKSDWQEQGSKMADIYSNCLVCIAADAAKDSGGGFLRTPGRQHAANQAHELTTAGIANVYVRRPAIEAYNVCVSRLKYSCHTWSEPADGPSPLSSRGWVLQETLLSPRILHFTSDELMWQCQSIAQCECAPGYTDFVREGSSKPDTSVELWSLTWDTAMENFMARNLTFQTDRLDSLAGLAKRMKSKAQAEGIRTSYVAGLWTHTLRMDLHWKREVKEPDPNVFDNEPSEPSLEEPFNPSSRIDPYIAPTWSWASITGRVQPASKVGHWRENTLRYMQEELRDELELEPITTDYLPASVNAFGAAMQGSSLTLRGEIFDVVVSQYNKLKDDNWGAPEYIAHFVDVEDDVPNPEGDRDITFEGRHECFFDTDEDEEAVKMGQRNLLALNLSNYTTFILLEQLYRSGSTRVCKRVGIVSDFESEFGLDFDVTRAAIFQGWGKRRKIKIV